ncbi:hypothetical protein Goshw_001490 [Gossypium schwendimanii]|uniref:Uncharacterized protein n=1 Tax=Gossypium schwendimanii TaxID=34291 RepID=A0A7J9L755_GOSSC|nr:hypothetical protein [Gossypium schwendimanii]
MAACIYPSKNIATPAMAEPGRVCMLSNLGKIWAFDNCVKGDTLIVIKGINDAKDDKSHISNVLKAAKAGWHHEQPEYWMEEAPASVVEMGGKLVPLVLKQFRGS